MSRLPASWCKPFYELSQLARHLKTPRRSGLHNCFRQPPALRFLTELEKDPSQLRFAQSIDQVRSRRPMSRIHPHVQRSIVLETKAALRLVQLRRTHPQIEE